MFLASAFTCLLTLLIAMSMSSSASTRHSTPEALLWNAMILEIPVDDRTIRSSAKWLVSCFRKNCHETICPPYSLLVSNNSIEFQMHDKSLCKSATRMLNATSACSELVPALEANATALEPVKLTQQWTLYLASAACNSLRQPVNLFCTAAAQSSFPSLHTSDSACLRDFWLLPIVRNK